MHVSIGGPEGSGDGESYGLNNLIGDSFNAVAETFGKLSGIFIQPGVPRDDIPGMITDTAIKTNAAVVESKEIQLPKTATIITPPNINRNSEGPAQAPATSTDTESITYYLRRFAMQDISTPIIALKPAMAK
jgi:hypothetical protein